MQFLTVREAAKQLHVGVHFIYRLLWDEKLIAHKEDKRWLISLDSVKARQARQQQRQQQKEARWQMNP